MIEQPMENRKWFQKRDLLLILLVGAAAAVLFFWPKEQGAAAVSYTHLDVYKRQLDSRLPFFSIMEKWG